MIKNHFHVVLPYMILDDESDHWRLYEHSNDYHDTDGTPNRQHPDVHLHRIPGEMPDPTEWVAACTARYTEQWTEFEGEW